jgi:hypothetical protein
MFLLPGPEIVKNYSMAEEKTLSNDELEARWTALRRTIDTEGVASCCKAIAEEPDPACRVSIFKFAIRKLGGGVGATSADLDAMIAVGDSGIVSMLEIARRSGDEARWTDQANITAYNLSANLCDCWGDGDSRLKRHFEAGLRYAGQALEFRRQLKKGPGPFSMAYWAQGKHLLSLKRPAEAAAAFRASLEAEESMVRENKGDPGDLGSAPGSLLNSRAFLGLALRESGQVTGAAMLDECLTLLRSQAEHGEGEVKEDAQVYLDQIVESVRRIGVRLLEPQTPAEN